MARPPSTGRYRRALEDPQVDPHDHDPNPNPAVGTVGTHTTGGPVMSWSWPEHSEAWSGWPSGWGTPYMESSPTFNTFFGYGADHPDGWLFRCGLVGMCVDMISKQLSAMPAYRVKDRVPGSLPGWYLTPEPSLYVDWTSFMKTAINAFLLHGEIPLYAVDRYADDYPSRFVVLNPSRLEDRDGDWWLSVDRYDDSARRVGFDYTDGQVRIPPDDVCVIPYQQLTGSRRGIGPLAWAGRFICADQTLDRYANQIAQNGVWAILKHPGQLTAQQSDALKQQWMAARSSSVGAPAVLSGGVEYSTLSLSPKDMALLDLRTFDDQMIAAAFGVPAMLLNLPQAASSLQYTSTEMTGEMFWRLTLRPLAQAVASAMSMWLLPYGSRMEFDADELVRAEPAARAQYYATMHGIVDADGRQAMTVDEIRMAERFTPYTDPAPPLDDVADLEANLLGLERA